MTESRKLRAFRASSVARRENELKCQGFVEVGEEWVESWLCDFEDRLTKAIDLKLVALLGKRRKPRKLPPGTWEFTPRPRMFIQPVALKVYKHLDNKYGNAASLNDCRDFEEEFFTILQKWVDDRDCEDALVGTLELEAETFPKDGLRLLPRSETKHNLELLKRLEEHLFTGSGITLSTEDL